MPNSWVAECLDQTYRSVGHYGHGNAANGEASKKLEISNFESNTAQQGQETARSAVQYPHDTSYRYDSDKKL